MSAESSRVTNEKSFDVLASVRLFNYDLQTSGQIRPETKHRVLEEELSYIAEGINLPNYTEFVLHEQNGELVYFHEGRWQPYMATLLKGLRVAEAEAAADPRKQFEVDRRVDDLKRGYQLDQLEAGQKLQWHYEFPYEQRDQYGTEFIESLGFYAERAMGYLCEAEKTHDGRLILRHQSVDNSDKDGYSAAMAVGARGADLEEMTRAYDDVLSQKKGGRFYAGRPLDSTLPEHNAWTEITRHVDLVDFLMRGIEAIAIQNLPAEQTEVAKKRLTYGVWARLKERLDDKSLNSHSYSNSGSIQQQVDSAYEAAAARGEVMFGCGGTIVGEAALLQASDKDVFSMIFGNQKKWFGCYYCGAQQYGDPCASRLYCSTCQAEVKNGRVISTGHGRSVKKGFLDILVDSLAEEFRRWNMQQKQAKAEKERRQAAEAKTKTNTLA